MKRVLQLLIVFSCVSILAQEDWIYVQTELDVEGNGISEAISVVNQDNGDLFLFLKESRNGIAYLIDENKQILGEVDITHIPSRAYKFVGNAFKDNTFTLFFANQSERRYSSVFFDFNEKTSGKIDEIDIPLKKERSIGHFSNDNDFFILTAVRNSSKLKLYTFGIKGNHKVKTIDLSNEVFETSNGLKTSLYNLMFAGNGTTTRKKVEVGEPTSLEIANADNKFYFQDNTITITSDYLDRYTYIVDLDVIDGSYEFTKYEHVNYNKDRLRTRSNSFIYDNYFFNIYASSKQLDFLVYDRSSKQIINQYSATVDSEIDFKNSPIILEGAGFSKYRQLDKTKQFLRKIVGSNIAISAHRIEDKFLITLGSSEMLPTVMPIVAGGAIGGLIGGALFAAFNSYSNTKSTRINCLFDEDFNHIEGEIPRNQFDEVDDYIKTIKKPNAQTMFKYKDDYVWGSYIKNSRIYRLVRFN